MKSSNWLSLLCTATSAFAPISHAPEKPTPPAAGEATPFLSSQEVLLGSLRFDEVIQARDQPRANLSTEGNPLTIAGRKYASGPGTHARSVLWLDLEGACQRFTAQVGVDDEVVPRNVLRELIAAA